MTRKRTTKTLASRIQVDYLKRSIPFRYWKRILIMSVGGVALIWALSGLWPGQKKIYAPGPVSKGHKIFEQNCDSCHIELGEEVSNHACLKCHTDQIHRQEESFRPRCSGCHREHKSADLISVVHASDCAQCHAHLIRKDKKPTSFARRVTDLEGDHPDFRFFESKLDPTAMKLNHQVHLKPGLEGKGGERVTLKCGDCHDVDLAKDPEGIYRNAKITYERHCQDCHVLGIDRKFPNAVAPHKKPEEVRNFLTQFFEERLKADPALVWQMPVRDLPGPLKRGKPVLGVWEWLRERQTGAERQLFGKVCLECHEWSYQPGLLPTVPNVEMRMKYLHYGRFDHAAHRAMACASCHIDSRTSEKSSDFLIPHLTVCVDCHRQGGVADESCQECHRYHPLGPEKVMEGEL